MLEWKYLGSADFSLRDGAASSFLVQQKTLGLLFKINLTPLFSYFLNRGAGTFLHVSEFSVLEFIIIAIWKDTGWLWVDGIIAGRSCWLTLWNTAVTSESPSWSAEAIYLQIKQPRYCKINSVLSNTFNQTFGPLKATMCWLYRVGKHFLPIKYECNTFYIRHGMRIVQNVKTAQSCVQQHVVLRVLVKSWKKNVCMNHLPQYSIWIFNATSPSDHKSAFIESLVPGTRL